MKPQVAVVQGQTWKRISDGATVVIEEADGPNIVNGYAYVYNIDNKRHFTIRAYGLNQKYTLVAEAVTP